MSADFATGGGSAISIDDIALAIKVGLDRGLMQDILLKRIAARRAERDGITVADDEIDQALADFCGERELFTPTQVQAWLAKRKLGVDAIRNWLRETLLADKLKQRLAPDDAVRTRFAASPYDFSKAQVQAVRFASEGAAAETMLQLREAECTWEQAVSHAGEMEAGVMRRCDSPPDTAALFVAAPGDFLGPIERDEGGYSVYRVIRTIEPALDDDLMNELRESIYRDALIAALESDPLQFRS